MKRLSLLVFVGLLGGCINDQIEKVHEKARANPDKYVCYVITDTATMNGNYCLTYKGEANL